MTRWVLDTNIWLSGLWLRNSFISTLASYALQHNYVVFSQATYNELAQVLWRTKFDDYISVSERK